MLPAEKPATTRRPTRRSRHKPRGHLTPALVPDSPPESSRSHGDFPEQQVPDDAVSPQPQSQDTTVSRELRDQRVPEEAVPCGWKLTPIELSPVRRIRPTRVLLKPGDPRIWRYTDPREDPTSVPRLLFPLRRTSPRPNVTRETQTSRLQTNHRVIQHAPEIDQHGTQTDPWASTSDDNDEPVVLPGYEIWGPIRVTITAPHISYLGAETNIREQQRNFIRLRAFFTHAFGRTQTPSILYILVHITENKRYLLSHVILRDSYTDPDPKRNLLITSIDFLYRFTESPQ